jgi:carboxyl-terminal processing protease
MYRSTLSLPKLNLPFPDLRAWVLLLGLLVGSVQATPASDLLDEAADLLRRYYIAYQERSLVQTIDIFQKRLERLCAGQPNCPVEQANTLIEEMIALLADEHTLYFSPSQFGELQRQIEGGSVQTPQLGVVLTTVTGVPGLLITDVLAGGPAEEAGLRRGDRLLQLNGVGFPSAEGARNTYLRMFVQSGELLQLTVARANETFVVQMRGRAMPSERLPTLRLLDQGVALLRIPSFAAFGKVAPRVHELVAQAQSKGAVRMIIDLRDNPGGIVTECLAAAGAFIEAPYRRLEGTQPTVEYAFRNGAVYGRSGLDKPLYTLAPALWKGPVVLLVNQKSASCAEFFALDLQPQALVIGQPTLGVANTATTLQTLSNGAGLQITSSRVYLSDGRMSASRVTPTLNVNDDLQALSAGRDAALEAAQRMIMSYPLRP